MSPGRADLSVVVPIYNVADYLADSLDSVLRQPVSHTEIILVDDGSTDGSLEIAQRYAAEHAHISLFTQPNSGVSIARNFALTKVTAPLLTFVDPDDFLPADAWSKMLRILRRTGSDFVVGAAERVEGGRRYTTPLMAKNHQSERLGIRIEDAPLMLADVFVWNKIFHTDFWRAAKIHFPERTRYQDQVALTQAFLAARAFDVLPDVVYDWEVRPSNNSATQRRKELSNLTERINTKQQTYDLVHAYGNHELERVLLRDILPIDLWAHFRSVPGAADGYWELLVDGVRRFWGESMPVRIEDSDIPRRQRLMAWFALHDRRSDLEQLLQLIDAHDGLPAEHPWSEEVPAPLR